MTYAQFISKLRAEAKDLARPMHNDFTGDGTTTLFVVTDSPILEGSYVIQVNSVQKTEGSDYTLDRELGLITFASAPTNGHAIDIDYKYVHLTDSSWITVINRVLSDMSGEFFREIVDEDFEDSVADQLDYACATNVIDVIEWWYKTSTNASENWTLVRDFSNWRYSADLNKLFMGRPFFTTGYKTKIHALKGYALGDETTDTLDIQDKYEGILQLGCLWKYYDYRLADRVETTTKVAKERTVTPLQNIQSLSAHYYKLYLKEKGRKKPTKPLRVLNNRLPNGGTP